MSTGSRGSCCPVYRGVLIEVSIFQGVLIRGAPAVLFIEVSLFQGVLTRGVPAVLFIEVSLFQGVLTRGAPAVLFIEVSSSQGSRLEGTLYNRCTLHHYTIPVLCLGPLDGCTWYDQLAQSP